MTWCLSPESVHQVCNKFHVYMHLTIPSGCKIQAISEVDREPANMGLPVRVRPNRIATTRASPCVGIKVSSSQRQLHHTRRRCYHSATSKHFARAKSCSTFTTLTISGLNKKHIVKITQPCLCLLAYQVCFPRNPLWLDCQEMQVLSRPSGSRFTKH